MRRCLGPITLKVRPDRDQTQYRPEIAQTCLGVTEDFQKAYCDDGHYTHAGARAFGVRVAETGWRRATPADNAEPRCFKRSKRAFMPPSRVKEGFNVRTTQRG